MQRATAILFPLLAFAILAVSGCAARSAGNPDPWVAGCASGGELSAEEMLTKLSSWADGDVKRDLVSYLLEATCRDRNTYLEEKERIAAFDLDGTLIPEKPHYFEVLVALSRLKEEANSSPDLKAQQPYQASVENDSDYIDRNGEKIILEAAGGETLSSYRQRVVEYLTKNRHPHLDMAYDNLFYKPMIELISLLQELAFDVYVVSGSQQEYLRSFSKACLGIDGLKVVGSMVKFETGADGSFVRQDRTWDPPSDGAGKVYRIRERAGALPVLYFGNSFGDKELLERTSSMPHGRGFLLDHDDPEREYEYHGEKVLALAKENDWTIISMKEDFQSLYMDSNCLAP